MLGFRLRRSTTCRLANGSLSQFDGRHRRHRARTPGRERHRRRRDGIGARFSRAPLARPSAAAAGPQAPSRAKHLSCKPRGRVFGNLLPSGRGKSPMTAVGELPVIRRHARVDVPPVIDALHGGGHHRVSVPPPMIRRRGREALPKSSRMGVPDGSAAIERSRKGLKEDAPGFRHDIPPVFLFLELPREAVAKAHLNFGTLIRRSSTRSP